MFAAIGMAFVVIRTWGVDPSEPTQAMLEGPFALALLFLCLIGLRGAYELPAELPANWAFRFHTDASRLHRYLAGARKAAWLAAPLPLALLTSLVVASLWGAQVAIPHMIAMFMRPRHHRLDDWRSRDDELRRQPSRARALGAGKHLADVAGGGLGRGGRCWVARLERTHAR
jgi:hypothetical protein